METIILDHFDSSYSIRNRKRQYLSFKNNGVEYKSLGCASILECLNKDFFQKMKDDNKNICIGELNTKRNYFGKKTIDKDLFLLTY